MSEAEALREEAEAGLVVVTQALDGLGLTPFQNAFVRKLFEYEQMRLEEGWVDEWAVDLAAQLHTGSP
jgi:hypothetical protein